MVHKFSKHQILNITIGRLHTGIGDVYEFFNKVIEPGIMTHHLPNACKAINPILREKFSEDFFVDEYRPETKNEEMEFEFTDQDKERFWIAFKAIPSLLEGKEMILVKI